MHGNFQRVHEGAFSRSFLKVLVINLQYNKLTLIQHKMHRWNVSEMVRLPNKTQRSWVQPPTLHRVIVSMTVELYSSILGQLYLIYLDKRCLAQKTEMQEGTQNVNVENPNMGKTTAAHRLQDVTMRGLQRWGTETTISCSLASPNGRLQQRQRPLSLSHSLFEY